MRPERTRPLRPLSSLKTWKLEDAKARLSEVVRLAGAAGPQLVTSRGKQVAVILTPDQYNDLVPTPRNVRPLIQFIQGLGLSLVETEREYDAGREVFL